MNPDCAHFRSDMVTFPHWTQTQSDIVLIRHKSDRTQILSDTNLIGHSNVIGMIPHTVLYLIFIFLLSLYKTFRFLTLKRESTSRQYGLILFVTCIYWAFNTFKNIWIYLYYIQNRRKYRFKRQLVVRFAWTCFFYATRKGIALVAPNSLLYDYVLSYVTHIISILTNHSETFVLACENAWLWLINLLTTLELWLKFFYVQCPLACEIVRERDVIYSFAFYIFIIFSKRFQYINNAYMIQKEATI